MKLRLLFLCSLSPIRFQKISPRTFLPPPPPLSLRGVTVKKTLRKCVGVRPTRENRSAPTCAIVNDYAPFLFITQSHATSRDIRSRFNSRRLHHPPLGTASAVTSGGWCPP